MDQITVNAMVLSASPAGETDKRIVLLTTQMGCISAFVRGARKPNSQLLAVSRPFCAGEFRLYQGRDSYTVQGADIKEYFEKLAEDPEAAAYGCYFMEMAGYYTKEGMDGREMLNLLFLSLKALENKSLDNRLVRLIFECRVHALDGEYPQVFSCAECGKKLSSGWLSYRKGSCLCSSCMEKHTKDNVEFLSDSLIYSLQFMLTAPLNRLYTFNVSSKLYTELKNVIDRWSQRYNEREFKSLKVLNEILNLSL